MLGDFPSSGNYLKSRIINQYYYMKKMTFDGVEIYTINLKKNWIVNLAYLTFAVSLVGYFVGHYLMFRF